MRIISGKLGGRRLDKKVNSNVRPTTDRAKEQLFNTLENFVDLDDKYFLDLFAGSGSVGLEAVSRGAYVTFNDKEFKNTVLIKDYLREFNFGIHKVFKTPFNVFLKKINSKFDIIFADPPYESDFYSDILDMVLKYDLLFDNGILILEKRTNQYIEYTNFELLKEKQSGSSTFIFLELKT